VYRLATTLLNPRTAEASVLLDLYHQRWEVELVIDEIKTHQREQRKVLRSKTPSGVIQEVYGIFLAHYAIRFMMAQAAIQADVDEDAGQFYQGDVSTGRPVFFFSHLAQRRYSPVSPTPVSPYHTRGVTIPSFACQSAGD
jgi:hypothetical protein